MPRYGFQLGLLGGDERLSVVPAVVGNRQNPVVPLVVPDDPLLSSPVHEDRHHLLPYRGHLLLLPKSVECTGAGVSVVTSPSQQTLPLRRTTFHPSAVPLRAAESGPE